MPDMALLGMAGSATAAIFAAAGFVIHCAVRVGRHLQVMDEMKTDLKTIDLKVERHLQWHEGDGFEEVRGNAE